MEEKEQKVIEAMRFARKPVRPAEIAESTSIESKEVSKIIKNLRQKGLVHSPKRCYYEPTEE
jgi:predicted transcriptional regulator